MQLGCEDKKMNWPFKLFQNASIIATTVKFSPVCKLPNTNEIYHTLIILYVSTLHLSHHQKIRYIILYNSQHYSTSFELKYDTVCHLDMSMYKPFVVVV